MNTSTPEAKKSIQVFGGDMFEGVQFSRAQIKALATIYGISDQIRESAVEASQNSETRTTPDVSGVRSFLEAGDQRNVFRHAKNDGLRLIAFLSKYLEPGQDPVKMLIPLMADAGYDIDPSDIAWAEQP